MSPEHQRSRSAENRREDVEVFTNPFDPSDDELRRWAQSERDASVQDFDLMVATDGSLRAALSWSSRSDLITRCGVATARPAPVPDNFRGGRAY
jgi:hypothetical protein